MKTGKPTMSDIARELGISTISVSRALAGQDGVSGELRSLIRQKADEMGYFRAKGPLHPRVLVLHQKPIIQDNSNFSHIIQGVENALQDADCEYDMELEDKSSQGELRLPGRVLKGSRYDGAVLIGNFDRPYVEFLGAEIRHLVSLTGYTPAKGGDSVWYNFSAGAYRQCEYLIRQGHRKIAYLGNNRTFASQQKALGIRMALEDHGLPAEDAFFVYSEEDFESQVFPRIPAGQGPTAVICQKDYTAVKLLQFLHRRGIRVPEDVSVVGYGNTEMSALCIPALTTMELHIGYACETAVALLLKRLDRPDKPDESIRIDSTLIERDSVRPVAPD